MGKPIGRSNAALFFTTSTEHASGAITPHRGKRTREPFTDGVINGERVLVAHERRETEKGLMLRIRAALAVLPGVLVFRNNVGVDRGNGVRYGLGVGSGDLIGLVTVNGVGVFASWEVKLPRYAGRVRPEQKSWRDLIRRRGGIAGVVTTPEEAVAMVTEARRG